MAVIGRIVGTQPRAHDHTHTHTHTHTPPCFCPPVQDIADSRRINQNIHDDANTKAGGTDGEADETTPLDGLDATIVSELFWPTFRDEAITVPPQMAERFDAYNAAFGELKVPQWGGGVGRVVLGG